MRGVALLLPALLLVVAGAGWAQDDEIDFNPVPIPKPCPWAEGRVDAIVVEPSETVAAFLKDNPWLVERRSRAEFRVRGELVGKARLHPDASLLQDDAYALPTVDGRFVVVAANHSVAEAYRRRAAGCSDRRQSTSNPLFVSVRFEDSAAETVSVLLDPCGPTECIREDVVLVFGMNLMNSTVGIVYCSGSGCLGLERLQEMPPIRQRR